MGSCVSCVNEQNRQFLSNDRVLKVKYAKRNCGKLEFVFLDSSTIFFCINVDSAA